MRLVGNALCVLIISLLCTGCSDPNAWIGDKGKSATFGPYRFDPPSSFRSMEPPGMPSGVAGKAWCGPKDPPAEPVIIVTYTSLPPGAGEIDWDKIGRTVIPGMLAQFKKMCKTHSTRPTRRVTLNGLEGVRGEFTGKLKKSGDVRAIFYILVDNRNIVSVIAANAGFSAERSVARLDEAIQTFERPGYVAPPRIAKIEEEPAEAVEEFDSLSEARAAFQTKTVQSTLDAEPIEEPSDDFRKITYTSPVGKLGAYLTPDPGDGKKHPAIVWITGGDCNSLGDVWSPQPSQNEQSASAYRKAGIVMMFPSLRGGNENPGAREGFYGEVDDVLAAADYLAKQPYVDPKRIYLGGHSSGGTLVLLVAECSDRFRAVFSFGPVDNIAGYPREYLPFDVSNPREIELRAPVRWLHSIESPTFVFEGSDGNEDSLRKLRDTSKNDKVKFFLLGGEDHFNILSPINMLIAGKILQDDDFAANLSFDRTELTRQIHSPKSFVQVTPVAHGHSAPGKTDPRVVGLTPLERHMIEQMRANLKPHEDPSHPDYFKANLEKINSRSHFDTKEALERILKAKPEDIPDPELRAEIARAIRDLACDTNQMSSLRGMAVKGMVAWAGNYSVPILLELMNERRGAVKDEVIRALTELEDERAIEPLAQQFAAETFPDRTLTACLVKFGPKAEDAVLKYADMGDISKARSTIQILGKIGTAKSLRFFRQVKKNKRAVTLFGREIEAAILAIQQRAKSR